MFGRRNIRNDMRNAAKSRAAFGHARNDGARMNRKPTTKGRDPLKHVDRDFEWEAKEAKAEMKGGVGAYETEEEAKEAFAEETYERLVSFYEGKGDTEPLLADAVERTDYKLSSHVADEYLRHLARYKVEQDKDRPNKEYERCFKHWMLGTHSKLNNPLIDDRGYVGLQKQFPRAINWILFKMRMVSEVRKYLHRLYLQKMRTEEEVEIYFRYLVWPLNNAMRMLARSRGVDDVSPDDLRGSPGGQWNPEERTLVGGEHAGEKWPQRLTYLGRATDSDDKLTPLCLRPQLNKFLRATWVSDISYKDYIDGTYAKRLGDCKDLWDVVAQNAVWGRDDIMTTVRREPDDGNGSLDTVPDQASVSVPLWDNIAGDVWQAEEDKRPTNNGLCNAPAKDAKSASDAQRRFAGDFAERGDGKGRDRSYYGRHNTGTTGDGGTDSETETGGGGGGNVVVDLLDRRIAAQNTVLRQQTAALEGLVKKMTESMDAFAKNSKPASTQSTQNNTQNIQNIQNNQVAIQNIHNELKALVQQLHANASGGQSAANATAQTNEKLQNLIDKLGNAPAGASPVDMAQTNNLLQQILDRPQPTAPEVPQELIEALQDVPQAIANSTLQLQQAQSQSLQGVVDALQVVGQSISEHVVEAQDKWWGNFAQSNQNAIAPAQIELSEAAAAQIAGLMTQSLDKLQMTLQPSGLQDFLAQFKDEVAQAVANKDNLQLVASMHDFTNSFNNFAQQIQGSIEASQAAAAENMGKLGEVAHNALQQLTASGKEHLAVFAAQNTQLIESVSSSLEKAVQAGLTSDALVPIVSAAIVEADNISAMNRRLLRLQEYANGLAQESPQEAPVHAGDMQMVPVEAEAPDEEDDAQNDDLFADDDGWEDADGTDEAMPDVDTAVAETFATKMEKARTYRAVIDLAKNNTDAAKEFYSSDAYLKTLEKADPDDAPVLRKAPTHIPPAVDEEGVKNTSRAATTAAIWAEFGKNVKSVIGYMTRVGFKDVQDFERDVLSKPFALADRYGVTPAKLTAKHIADYGSYAAATGKFIDADAADEAAHIFIASAPTDDERLERAKFLSRARPKGKKNDGNVMPLFQQIYSNYIVARSKKRPRSPSDDGLASKVTSTALVPVSGVGGGDAANTTSTALVPVSEVGKEVAIRRKKSHDD